MPKVNYVKKARKAIIANNGEQIQIGEPYYWWKFRYSGKIASKTPPRPRDLTQSSFLQSVYDLKIGLTISRLKTEVRYNQKSRI